MIILERISQLPKNVIFKLRVSKTVCEDADYVYFHNSLKYYSCYFKVKGVKYDSK